MNYRKANCYGYAFGKNRWFLIECFRRYSRNYEKCVEELEERYNLKRVRRQDMVLGKEYIAFRVGLKDYHFMKRGKKGHWRHKQGRWQIQPISEKEVFAPQWFCEDLIYDSKIYLYEV